VTGEPTRCHGNRCGHTALGRDSHAFRQCLRVVHGRWAQAGRLGTGAGSPLPQRRGGPGDVRASMSRSEGRGHKTAGGGEWIGVGSNRDQWGLKWDWYCTATKYFLLRPSAKHNITAL